jgi:cellulose biosynthesis protein BcsQ
MRTVTFANFKGGAGKTTLAHHLSERADEAGYRVVTLDTDPPGRPLP